MTSRVSPATVFVDEEELAKACLTMLADGMWNATRKIVGRESGTFFEMQQKVQVSINAVLMQCTVEAADVRRTGLEKLILMDRQEADEDLAKWVFVCVEVDEHGDWKARDGFVLSFAEDIDEAIQEAVHAFAEP